jgi:hypothetical protein
MLNPNKRNLSILPLMHLVSEFFLVGRLNPLGAIGEFHSAIGQVYHVGS